MNEIIDKLCDEIRELGRDFETAENNGNPIESACNQSNAELCNRLAEVIRLTLTGREK